MGKTPSAALIKAARYELKKRAARQSLAAFTLFTCPGYQMGWVHQEICDALDQFLADVIAKKSPRLIITMPPRSGKSEIVSRRFPAYALGRCPDLQIIATSYGSSLSQRFNRDVQRIIDDDAYREVFPETTLSGMNARTSATGSYIRTADLFEIVGHRGAYRSTGVGGGITGQGAECVLEGAKVVTPYGERSIETICAGMPVLAYNEKTGKPEWHTVQAVRVKDVSNRLIRISSDGGRSLFVTGNHPVYADGRFKRADLLATGQMLLCVVREGLHPERVRMEEEGFPRNEKRVLLKGMLSGIRKQKGGGETQVHTVWCPRKERTEVLPGVSARCATMEVRDGETTHKKTLRVLRETLSCGTSWPRHLRKILLHGLQERISQRFNESRGKCPVQKLGRSTAEQGERSKGVPRFATLGLGAGRVFLRPLRRNGKPDCASRQPQSRIERNEESRNPLQEVSRRGSSTGGSWYLRGEHIAEVECVPLNGRSVRVYDLQVEGCHNFFANGILVHNCLIIDDPVKDRASADSPTTRESTWDWYTSTAYTRLSPGGGVIAMATRWNTDDLIGRLIEQDKRGTGDHWTLINYPAIAERDEIHRKAGEALHPERYPLEALMKIRAAIGSRDWAALYQQSPVPDGGGLFKREWIQYWDKLPDRFDSTCISWDMTFKDSKTSDYVVGQVWGRKDGCFYLIDQFRGQWDFVKTLDQFVAAAQKYPRVTRKLVEDKANGSAIISTLKRKVSGIIPITPKESKEARASAVTTLWEAKNVFLPPKDRFPWVERDFIPELLSFPSGAHDDQIDSMSQALNDLNKRGTLKIDQTNIEYLGRFVNR